MKRTPIIVLALVCATVAQAQQDQPQQSDQQANPPAQASQPAPAQTPSSVFVDPSILTGMSARASKVIGSKVYRGDTTVGEIKDVLLDLNHATVPAVIISTGGLLGMNEKQVAVPAAAIKVGKEARFTIDLTEDQLKAAPAFDPGKL